MARMDDYKKALELACEDAEGLDPERIAGRMGARCERGEGGVRSVTFRFLGRPVKVTWPVIRVERPESGSQMPIQEQVLVLHYLKGAEHVGPLHRWISYQEVPDGRFYLGAFQNRAKAPLVRAFGGCPEKLATAAQKLYGATPFEQGDQGVVVEALPGVPVALVLWEGDDEFPPEGNLLFDESIIKILSAEDIAWLAGMIVYPLVGALKSGQV
ncbi:MAG: DUF3786 domain-containing protein [Deltaproteobacteria bacterium]|nr:DUF3786 domain-containing protein [Deltaproteobacteria bacterium]